MPSRTTINSTADYYFQEDEQEEVPTQEEQDLVSSSQSLPRTLQQQQWRVPGDALEDRGWNSAYYYREQLSVSHAHWRLMLRSVSPSTTTPSTTLTAAPGARFLAQVLQRLENLSHLQRLQLSFGEEEVILEVMAQQQSLGHCQNLQSFTANHGSTTRQFRFFLETLPNLSSLKISAIDDNHYTAQEGQESELEAVQPVLIHNALKSLCIDGYASGFGKSRVRLERLETFTACSLGPEIMDLERLLRWFMPNCKTVKVAILSHRCREPTSILSFLPMIPATALALFLEESTSTATASDAVDQGQAKQGRTTVPLAVQEIEYDYRFWLPTREVQESLEHMPFLTKIEFQHRIDGSVVETLSKSCPKLQRLRVSGRVRGVISRGVSKLLAAYPDLLEVSGPCLALRATDVIQYQPWVCLGLKKLECRIISVPRLTDQEQDQVLKLDRDLKTPESLGVEFEQERRCWDQILWKAGDEGMKQAHSRIQMLRRNRGLLRLRSRSREVQEQVFSGLARLQNLEILNLGEATKQDKAVRDRPCTLEWSFESGVQRLESLTKLKVLEVNLYEHRIRENQEVVWMKNSWPRLEVGPL
ncbi:hypothetical protein BGZ83_009445 [Gryganskiella cystojenkinii]|nr:hypothetical protein BGZ83_009445 [Gryganskiella cystojenkinii]